MLCEGAVPLRSKLLGKGSSSLAETKTNKFCCLKGHVQFLKNMVAKFEICYYTVAGLMPNGKMPTESSGSHNYFVKYSQTCVQCPHSGPYNSGSCPE